MTVRYTKQPKNKFKRAKGMGDSTYFFKGSSMLNEKESRTRYWGIYYEEAYNNPGITQRRYCEENEYEYEIRVTWYPDTQTIVTNSGGCTNMNHHHLGMTCPVCKQHG